MKHSLILFTSVLTSVLVSLSAIAGPAFSGAKIPVRGLASDGPHSAGGTISYASWGSDMGDTGALVISGKAAELLWGDMTQARLVPAAADLESRHPSMISREDCESRVGKNIVCRRIPKMNADSVVRQNGKVVYSIQCDINIASVPKGEIGAQ